MARRIALQGLGAPYPLSPLTLALQGLFGSGAVDTPATEQPRAAIVGRGPGTTINLSDYLASTRRRRLLPATAVHTSAHTARKRANQKRQRQILAATLLTDF